MAKELTNSIHPNKNKSIRNDIANVICARFINFITKDDEEQFEEKQIENIIEFCQLEVIPSDIKLSMMLDIQKSKNKSLKAVMKSKAVTSLFMNLQMR